ncbi:hypothetical protein L9F63_027768, partial [Diploptera punctata]
SCEREPSNGGVCCSNIKGCQGSDDTVEGIFSGERGENYANIRIGPVVKKDVMKASTMLEHDSQYATILAFDVKVERDAQELADVLGVKIFQADIIYHLFDKFMAYREELKQKKREEFKTHSCLPLQAQNITTGKKLCLLFIFNSRDPIVMGVMIEAGIVKEGTPICVPSRESDIVELGVVTSIEITTKLWRVQGKGKKFASRLNPSLVKRLKCLADILMKDFL